MGGGIQNCQVKLTPDTPLLLAMLSRAFHSFFAANLPARSHQSQVGDSGLAGQPVLDLTVLARLLMLPRSGDVRGTTISLNSGL